MEREALALQRGREKVKLSEAERFKLWMLKHYGGMKITKEGVEKGLGLLSLNSIQTYFKWVRTYLQRVKNPLNIKNVVTFLTSHPNTSAMAALRYYFEFKGKELHLPKTIRKHVAKYTSIGKPYSGRRHDCIPWQEWVKIIDALPDALDKEEARALHEKIGGAYMLSDEKVMKHVKAILMMQLLWGLRVGDAIKTEEVAIKETKTDKVIMIKTFLKGEREADWLKPIHRKVLAGSKKTFLLDYFDYLWDFFKEIQQKSGEIKEPFHGIRTSTGRMLSLSGVYSACYAAIRYAADMVFKKKQSTHDIRKAVITTLLSEGKPLPAVSKWIGHKKVETTMRYYREEVSDKDIFS